MAKHTNQIPISFPVADSYDAHDFMPSECNQNALEWIKRFPDWPYPALIIYGEKGCGKTHLLKIWSDIAKDKGIAIDDVDTLFGNKESEEALFHQFNQMKEQGRFLFLSLSELSALDKIKLPDLASRLKAAPRVEIESPTDDVLRAVMVKAFYDRQLDVAPEVITYSLPRIERSYQAIHDLIATLDTAALAQRRAITVPLVRDILVEPELF